MAIPPGQVFRRGPLARARRAAGPFALVLLVAGLGACSVHGPPCPFPGRVCQGTCTDILSSADNCGACGTPCAAGRTCADGACLAYAGMLGQPGGELPESATVYPLVIGAGTPVEKAAQPGFGVTSATAHQYRVVWAEGMPMGARPPFFGSVYAAAPLLAVTSGCGGACTLDGGDLLSKPVQIASGYRVDFSSDSAMTLKGFDFQTTATVVYFALRAQLGSAGPANLIHFEQPTGDMTLLIDSAFGVSAEAVSP